MANINPNAFYDILKELYGDLTIKVGNTVITDELIASFTKLETLIYQDAIIAHNNRGRVGSLSELLYKDNPFLKLIDKSNSFQGAVVSVPLTKKKN